MEIEAKFTAPDAGTLERLGTVGDLAGYGVAGSEVATMSDTYLDTTGRALAAARLMCRRRDRGDRIVVTVKRSAAASTSGEALAGEAAGALHRREEYEFDLPAGLPSDAQPEMWPAGATRELVLAATAGRPLEPLAEARQHRILRTVSQGGREVAELSLDTFTIVVAGAARPPEYEVEVELKGAGTEADVAVIAEYLQREWRLVPQPLSKYERALAALAADDSAAGPLLDDDEQVLTQIARRSDAAGRRARALLALNEGLVQREVGARADMAPRTVRYWLARYRREGLGIFPPRIVAQATRGAARTPTERIAQVESPPARPVVRIAQAPSKRVTEAPSVRVAEASSAQVAAAPEKQAPAPAGARPRRGGKRPAHPGIKASDTMAEAAFKTLRFHFLRMLDNEPGTRAGDDIEHLHDMRVATRRMRAALRVFGPYLDPKVMRPIERGLRRTGRTLGAVRDLDVFHEKTQRYLDGLPEARRAELDPLLDVWRERREHARTEMLAYLDGAKYPRFAEEFEALLDEGAGRASLSIVSDDGEARPHRVAHVLPAVLYDRAAAVWAYDDVIEGPDTPLVRFHRLRIAGKFMRYTFEFFEEVLGADAKPLIKATKDMQDHLGDLQDAVVSCTILRNFLTWGTWEPPAGNARRGMIMVVAPGVAAYLAYRQDELHRLVDTFPQMWPTIRGEGFSGRLARVAGSLRL